MKISSCDGTAVDGGAPARILLVGGEPDFRADLARHLCSRHRCTHVSRLDEAQSAIGRQRFDLVLVTPTLPDGDGLEIARRVAAVGAGTKTIVFAADGSFKLALRAMRSGATDFIRTPCPVSEFSRRIEAALVRSAGEKVREDRIQRLQLICRELSDARSEISEQVDALVADLVAAYQELTEQINDVAIAAEFRTLLGQELDLEEGLRTMLEYLLAKTGPTNAAVFLPDASHHFSLGAYVNYDCRRESIDALLEHLARAICPQLSDEEDLVAFDDADEFASWIGHGAEAITGSQIIAFSCRAGGDCLAVVILFRRRDTPFEPSLAGTLDILRSIFAEQLAQIIKIHHRAAPRWPADADGDDDLDLEDDFGFGYEGGLAA
jgi:DNA-binding response OmpR family regulator